MIMVCFNTLWIYTALKPGFQEYYYNIVSIPSEFTLLSNFSVLFEVKFLFQYPLNLHCSQTVPKCKNIDICFNTLWIYTALKLKTSSFWFSFCFNTLWIYTALKQQHIRYSSSLRFNTLWIYTALKPSFNKLYNVFVSIPSEFTLLSNYVGIDTITNVFQYPLNLHCSQTRAIIYIFKPRFQYPLNLHCSQTMVLFSCPFSSFNTLWIYTALKPMVIDQRKGDRFNTLWIYTALKLYYHIYHHQQVSIPSEFTLLSNMYNKYIK